MMKSITAAVQSFLEHEEIAFEQTELAGVLKLGFLGKNGCFRGYVDVDEDKRIVQVRTLAPVVVSRSRRSRVAELVTRINERLVLGTVELSMDSSSVACRTSIILGESNPHHDVLEHLLYVNWCAMDTFFPAINAVLFGNMVPKDALDATRRRPSQPDEETPAERLRRRLGEIQPDSMN